MALDDSEAFVLKPQREGGGMFTQILFFSLKLKTCHNYGKNLSVTAFKYHSQDSHTVYFSIPVPKIILKK